MPRVDAFCEAAGKKPEDAWVMWGCDKKFGPYEKGCWKKLFLETDMS